jgi:esterase/lipase
MSPLESASIFDLAGKVIEQASRGVGPYIFGGVAAVGLGAVGGLAASHATTSTAMLGPRPRLAVSYDEARERAERFDEDERKPLNPLGRTRLFAGDGPTDEVVVLFHGMTNCVHQFTALAKTLHARGATVFVPRLPRHGLADRLNNGLERLTAEELRDCADSAVDIAAGLGRRVTVAGVSAGGVVATWAAQFRPEVARAAVIAPSFAFGGRIGVTAGAIEQALLLRLPNFGLDRFGNRKGILDHAYYNFPSHALGQVMRLGLAVFRAARQRPPVARSIRVIINASDPAVNDDVTLALVKRWRGVGYGGAQVYEFDKRYKLIHDIIDPAQAQQQTALVYPILLDAISGKP